MHRSSASDKKRIFFIWKPTNTKFVGFFKVIFVVCLYCYGYIVKKYIRYEEESIMPEISLFYGIRVTMYYDDHNPPHFHAEYNGNKALIEIDEEE